MSCVTALCVYVLVFFVCVLQSGASAAAVRGRRSGRGFVLDGSDDDAGGSSSADAEDRPAGRLNPASVRAGLQSADPDLRVVHQTELTLLEGGVSLVSSLRLVELFI